VNYARMAIERESPEQLGYETIRYNLAESSIRDRTLSDVGVELPDMLLAYGDHAGHPGFRELIAEQSGAPVSAGDVLLTAGAAHALFIVATSLLDPGDDVVVVRPNYATIIEVPRSIGAGVRYLDLRFEEGYRVDVERLAAMITPATRYVNLTVPNNPTGQVMTRAELDAVIELVERNSCRLLMDETYREMTFDEPLPVAAALSDRVISVSSLSKTYGIPGIRMGWAVCRDAALLQTLLAAKEQTGICTSVVDEEIGLQAFARRDEWLPYSLGKIAEALSVTRDWVGNEQGIEWVEPRGGVVCFPRLTVPVDEDAFYRLLLEEHGTYVGPGHWFERPRTSMRIGFGWPTIAELKRGLAAVSAAIAAAGR